MTKWTQNRPAFVVAICLPKLVSPVSCQLLDRMWGHDRIADRRLWTTRRCIRRVKRGLHRQILSAWGFVEHQMWTHRNNSGMPQNSSVKFFVWFVVERIIGLWSFECCRFGLFSLLFPFAVTIDHYDMMFAGLLVLLAFAGALLDEAVTGSQDMEPLAYIALECQF